MNMYACLGLFLEDKAAGFLRTTMSFATGFRTFAQLLSDGTILAAGYPGGVAEWLIAPVLKTGRPKGLVSSNLTPSAN